jgi:hypothetical protein
VTNFDGRLTQILTNVLSPDHDMLAIIYLRLDADGKTAGVSFATY